jgi:anti-sigma factor RsiW
VDCFEIQNLVHAYADGELDLAHELQIEQHLQECPLCASASETCRNLRSLFEPAKLSFQAPPGLRNRILRALPETNDPGRRPSAFRLPTRWLAVAASIAASLALAAVGSWALVQSYLQGSAENFLVKELTSSHVRSQLVVAHLTDVASTDGHTVKPWFNGKVNFSPPVVNLKEQGFPLIGGRVDFVDDKRVAVLVYKRHQHVINLFIWPSTAGVTRSGDHATTSVSTMSRQGYNLEHWKQGELEYWAVSDLNLPELQQFAKLVRERN